MLRDNYLQTLALSLAEAQAPQTLDAHARLMRGLERRGPARPRGGVPARRRGDRPARRGQARADPAGDRGAARLRQERRSTTSCWPRTCRTSRSCAPNCSRYFPQAMSGLGPDVLIGHRLRREIIATTVANALVNRVGPSFIEDTQGADRAGRRIDRAGVPDRADVFELEAVWRAIEALDNEVPAAAQTPAPAGRDRDGRGPSGALVPALGPSARDRGADAAVPARRADARGPGRGAAAGERAPPQRGARERPCRGGRAQRSWPTASWC